MAHRSHLFLELTNSLCPTCLTKVEAKVVARDGRVYQHKRCVDHGFFEVLISTDLDYYRRSRSVLTPAQLPRQFNTQSVHGCPYDCGLCPDHEQHSCLTLIEVTDGCNLTCPVCYSASSPERGPHRSLEQVTAMLDRVVENEGEPDVIQISGGEPTLHPELFTILERARERPIRHLMLNTNGIRIAAEAAFAEKLAAHQKGFEVYLQFDSLRPDPLRDLRGRDLTEVRMAAVERLNQLRISTTLVCTLKKGTNDDEVGAILDYALQQSCVRGVTFQPVQAAGRIEGYDPGAHRMVLSEVREAILEQSDVFSPDDIVPVPCHPDCLAMAYAMKHDGGVTPLTGLVDPAVLTGAAGSSITYESRERLQEILERLFSASASPAGTGATLRDLLCCLPRVEAPPELSYENVFRVIVMQFLDPWIFDVRSVKKACVHIVHPDGRIIPFDTYNIFYRDGNDRFPVVRAEAAAMPR